jgi:hypothetical protein
MLDGKAGIEKPSGKWPEDWLFQINGLWEMEL